MSTTLSVCVCPTSALPKRNTFLPNLLLRVAPDRDSTQWIRRLIYVGAVILAFSVVNWCGVVAISSSWLMLHGRTGARRR
jgi:hypothetical protein